MQGWTIASVTRGTRWYHLYWVCKEYFSNLLIWLHVIISVVMYSKYIQIESSGVFRIPKLYLLGSLYFSKDIQYKLTSKSINL